MLQRTRCVVPPSHLPHHHDNESVKDTAYDSCHYFFLSGGMLQMKCSICCAQEDTNHCLILTYQHNKLTSSVEDGFWFYHASTQNKPVQMLIPHKHCNTATQIQSTTHRCEDTHTHTHTHSCTVKGVTTKRQSNT